MADQVILCPYCKKEIPLTEAIAQPIREQMRREQEAKDRAKDEAFARKEADLAAQAQQVQNDKRAVAELVKQQVEASRKKIEQQALGKVREETALSLKDLENQLEEKKHKLAEAQEMELELRKQQRELREQKQALELEVARKLAAERQAIENQARARADEAHRLKDAEKDKTISDMSKQLDEMKQKLEQGSQQLQGEVAELELEALLREAFPEDRIEPVPKGMKGADALQLVLTRTGQYCGTIIWESKRTRNWSDGWIGKLKGDQREVKAEVAALVSVALPKTLSNLGCVNGVWVTDFACAAGLASALRAGLIQVAGAKASLAGVQDKKARLYEYLCGPEFKQRVEAMVEPFLQMQHDLAKEKADTERRWAKRHKQVDQVIKGLAGMCGDMQGIAGLSLPQLKSLDAKLLSAGQDDNAAT
jgi:hypothetical protein